MGAEPVGVAASNRQHKFHTFAQHVAKRVGQKNGLRANQPKVIKIEKGQTVAPLPKPGQRTIGRGVQTGVVYRLTNGELVYVQAPPK